jgi:glycosyltransferase involved in cell wall biosynthesis
VEVFSGQPYPQLDEGVALTPVPSLDLYRADDPFRRPRRDEFRDWIDALEYAAMCTAAFPEPLTFSLRVARMLRARSFEFDVVHDNQSFGYGLLDVARRIPLVASIHHPITIDRRLDLAHSRGLRRISMRRWYGFTKMQARVARRIPKLIAASGSAKRDAIADLRLTPGSIDVIQNGVDIELFRPLNEAQRVPGRIITTTSADVPIKGLVFLIEALAKLRTERDAELVVIGKSRPGGAVQRAIDRFGLGLHVRFETGIESLRLVELYSQAEVAVIPSLYEGFSLPAAEAMACEVPLVATTAGALPEVVGTDGVAGLLVPPKDAGELAVAIGRLLDDAQLRARMGAAGRRRVSERFTWTRTAAATTEAYRSIVSAANDLRMSAGNNGSPKVVGRC